MLWVRTNSELESVEGVLVDLLQFLLHLDGEVDQVAAVGVLVALKMNRVQTNPLNGSPDNGLIW